MILTVQNTTVSFANFVHHAIILAQHVPVFPSIPYVTTFLQLELALPATLATKQVEIPASLLNTPIPTAEVALKEDYATNATKDIS